MASFRCASAALALLLATVAPASAAEPVIALDYRAPSQCPSAAEFQRQIRGFVPGVAVAPNAAADRSFEVSIDESGTWGQLRLSTEQGPASRITQGADCAQVARLLAFAVALVLDPLLQLDEPLLSGVAPVGEAARRDEAILPPPLPALLAPSAAAADRPVASAPDRRIRSITHSLVAVGSIATATSPTPSYGIGALYGISATWRNLRPVARLGGSYFTSADVSRDGATVKFFSVLGAAEACPAGFAVGPIELRPCLRVDAGVRSTAGADIPGAKARVRPWLAIDPMLYARLAAASALFLELGAGAMVPAWHDHVFLRTEQTDLTVHQVPYVGFLGQIALGIEFGDRNRN